MGKQIKKPFILLSIFFLLLAFMPFSKTKVTAHADEIVANSITVFSWEDYIDESVLIEFEIETGIHVDYYTFSTNEEMYNEIAKDPDACDLLCPSEYMIMKMVDENLIKEFDMPQGYKQNVSPYIYDKFKELGLSTDEKTYTCGYMWGTMGYLFNADKFSADDFETWTSILNMPELEKKISIKNSIRDTYIMAVAMVYQEELLLLKAEYQEYLDSHNQEKIAEYNAKLTEIFNRRDQETVYKVERILVELKPKLYAFEVDAGKDDIISGKIDVNFAWSGDAVFAIDEAQKVGKNLGYAVPKEGTNVWFDGYVMTHNSRAKELASIKFLDYISRPEIAIRNMEYIGYTSVIGGQSVFDWMIDYFELETQETEGYEKVDLSYFFSDGSSEYVAYSGTSNRQFFAQYPPQDIIYRSAVMANFSDSELATLNQMWSRVKLITLPNYVLIIIAVIIVLGIVAFIIYKFKDKIFEKRIVKEQLKPRRRNCKVLKIEKIK